MDERAAIVKLLDIKQMFPGMDWRLDGDVLVIQTWLTESDANLIRDGQRMFAPL
jgi:hypothetical protein